MFHLKGNHSNHLYFSSRRFVLLWKTLNAGDYTWFSWTMIIFASIIFSDVEDYRPGCTSWQGDKASYSVSQLKPHRSNHERNSL